MYLMSLFLRGALTTFHLLDVIGQALDHVWSHFDTSRFDYEGFEGLIPGIDSDGFKPNASYLMLWCEISTLKPAIEAFIDIKTTHWSIQVEWFLLLKSSIEEYWVAG